jgi:hypothetical protein
MPRRSGRTGRDGTAAPGRRPGRLQPDPGHAAQSRAGAPSAATDRTGGRPGARPPSTLIKASRAARTSTSRGARRAARNRRGLRDRHQHRRRVNAALQRRGIPSLRITDEANLFQLGWGSRQKRLQATITGATNSIAVGIASDKQLTKTLLEQAGVPVPGGSTVTTLAEAQRVARRIKAR